MTIFYSNTGNLCLSSGLNTKHRQSDYIYVRLKQWFLNSDF